MLRSFSDRVLGGVCGGLAARLGLDAWALRGAVLLLTVATAGAFAAVYLALWLLAPMERAGATPRAAGLFMLLALGLTLAVVGGFVAWVLGSTQLPSGVDVFWPGLAFGLAVVVLLRQVSG